MGRLSIAPPFPLIALPTSDSQALREFLSLDEGSTDGSGRAATREQCEFSYDASSLFTPFRPPQFVLVRARFVEQATTDEATRRRVRATANVPFLWTDNPAPRTTLSRMRKVSQTGLEVDGKDNKMPFGGNCRSFDSATLKVLSDVGSVYGLFKTDLPFRPDHYTCLFVGQTNDLRARFLELYNKPAIAGVTHFFAEASANEEQRKLREKELIAEFNPPGNATSGAY
jgi:hypothetical protein